ncbi:hypothetical protein CAPTEDRAFT_196603 [Capitella teleta]|uniref:EGF-like domain-containing protein n=1 Tax=Capitella teleta TaxID=283909 RepID=R7U6Y0_CAPTE|nr:hypothetical protein CAPTEDRAFT_196603 [Capitella teleta]|eukprot:ELU02120.1 hypothetical protein CAPTEDRAFT_196603 [Capitella teleta]
MFYWYNDEAGNGTAETTPSSSVYTRNSLPTKKPASFRPLEFPIYQDEELLPRTRPTPQKFPIYDDQKVQSGTLSTPQDFPIYEDQRAQSRTLSTPQDFPIYDDQRPIPRTLSRPPSVPRPLIEQPTYPTYRRTVEKSSLCNTSCCCLTLLALLLFGMVAAALLFGLLPKNCVKLTECPKGYELDSTGTTCSDINECDNNLSTCSQNCTNIDGSFTCSCMDGFVLDSDGVSCSASACSPFTCPDGFELHENCVECKDIDECDNNLSTCSQNCTNIDGSFTCSCMDGFVLDSDGVSCSDLDECALNSSDCSQMCHNTPGSFYCSCRENFTLSDDDQVSCLELSMECII